jgi:outer membrane protein OmpA-like peptidoglycan-associated protein
MVEVKVDASELKNEGKEVISELADFLKEKTSAEVTVESEKVTVFWGLLFRR